MASQKSPASAKARVGTQEDVENIMGLFLMTFGHGVNPLHVHLDTVAAIRAHMLPSIEKTVLRSGPNWRQSWKKDAATVLGWMASVGRLSAQIAMEPKDRRTVVQPADFEAAMKVVSGEHKAREGGPIVLLGDWCP